MTNINFGVIGCGRWGRNYIKTLQMMNQKVWAYDSNLTVLNAVCGELKVEPITLLELKSVCDAVLIATPSNTHYRLVKEFLDDSTPVLCAKPLTLRYDEARELVDLAVNNRVILDCGYIYRFSNVVSELSNILRSNRVLEVKFKYFNDRPPRADSNIIWNLGIHCFDVIAHVFGEPTIKEVHYDQFTGKVVFGYKNFDVEVNLQCGRGKERSCLLYHELAGKKKFFYGDFDKNKTPLLQQEIQNFVDRILHRKQHVWDDLAAIRLCEEVCEHDNKK